MAITFATGSLALVTFGVATTLLVSERPAHQSTASPRPDLLAPEVPTGLYAEVLTAPGRAVSLSWDSNGSDPDLAGYVIYRSDRPEGGFARITEQPVLTNSFVDHDAPAGQPVYYRVSARDAARNESALSELTAASPAVGLDAPRLVASPRNAGI